MCHAQPDGARRSKLLRGTPDFASCCHAVFPTAPVRVSRRKSRPMCTFLKNRVRFVSRTGRLTCTKNLAHATLCPQKWCITTYTDVCTADSVSFLAPLRALRWMCRGCFGSWDLSFWDFRRRRLSSRRTVRLGTERPALPTKKACAIVHIFSPYFLAATA